VNTFQTKASTRPSSAASLRPPAQTKGRAKAPALGRPKGKFTQHRKMSRLLTLLEKQPQGLTIHEIAAALRVTTRSVRRYLEYLRDREADGGLESIPAGARGVLRWRMNPRDRGRAMNLRRTQAYGLLAVRPAFRALRGSALFEEIEIVTQQMLQLAQRPVRAGGGDIASDTRLEERFVLCPEVSRAEVQRGDLDEVFRAVADLRVLTFRYVSPKTGRGRSGDRGARVVAHPYAMVLYRGEVHCLARDTATGQVEAFSLARMRDSEPSESLRFEIPEDFKIDGYVHGPFGLGRARHPIVVEFRQEVADEIRSQRFHASQRLATAPDGRVRLSITVPSLDQALSWVLRYGSAARVVEPAELRDAVIRELRSATQRYGR
jgi:predicted DNA-binding transcriptional regulator YafY